MSSSKSKFMAMPSVYVLIPAYNEAENIFSVVDELRQLILGNKPLIKNVVVCDNASTDETAILARNAGALVVHEKQQGYGAACLRAIQELNKLNVLPQDIIVFVDGDHSVVAPEVKLIVEEVKQKAGLVVGARVSDQLQKGSMSLHQRVGNYIASRMIHLIWGVQVTDLGPLRGLHYQDLLSLLMQDENFGWTTEMQVKAIMKDMPYSEVNVSTRRRRGHSKISGTLSGTIGAAYGIFSTIFWLWWQAWSGGFSNQLYR